MSRYLGYITYVLYFLISPGTARTTQEGIVSNSTVYFSSHVPVNTIVGGPEPLKLRKILDMVRSSLCVCTVQPCVAGYLK